MSSTIVPPLPLSVQQLLKHRRTLLLQGPMGPFFARLAEWLELHGHQVTKVNFNGGDSWFYRRTGAVAFRGGSEDWLAWLRDQVASRRIDAIVLFGQTRPLHAAALMLARELGIHTYVFEEGYVRPDFVTLERGGVNADSSLPRTAAAYRDAPDFELPAPTPTGQTFGKLARLAMQYSVATWLGRLWFPKHEYHRPINPVREAALWIRAGWRKQLYRWRQSHLLDALVAPHRSKRWFLMPLQVATDSQILHHSPFTNMAEAIGDVIASFARHAPVDTWLVIKHHPMDRGHSDYTSLISEFANAAGVSDRVLYIHDLHLPTLLKHCKGVVTVNSTTGLQALYHKAPVCTLSTDCFYAIPGLVHTGPLEQFWQKPGKVDRALYRKFHREMVSRTQVNASFYAATPALDEYGISARIRKLQTQGESMASIRPHGAASNEEALDKLA